MNNFDGILSLYPQIVIDNFSPKLLTHPNIKLFILTHFHQDHMNGLEDVNLIKKLLTQRDTKFFCSPITRKFLASSLEYRYLSIYCTEIECETPTLFQLNDSQSVIVSFYGSGHCAGSVMCLISGDKGDVLFTGDFRIPIGSAIKLPFLANSQIHTVYMDCTFFRQEKVNLPSREESLNELISLIDRFPKHHIYITTSAKIGYEYVYCRIYQNFKQKVHVNECIFKMYDKIPEIQGYLTLYPKETMIHLCLNAQDKSKNRQLYHDSSENAIKIHLSTMWFTYFIESNCVLFEMKFIDAKIFERQFRLCYSFHSSFEEILEFVQVLKPTHLKPIALPQGVREQDVIDYFRRNSNLLNGETKQFTKNDGFESKHKELILRKRSSIFDNCSSENEEEFDFGGPAKKKISKN